MARQGKPSLVASVCERNTTEKGFPPSHRICVEANTTGKGKNPSCEWRAVVGNNASPSHVQEGGVVVGKRAPPSRVRVREGGVNWRAVAGQQGPSFHVRVSRVVVGNKAPPSCVRAREVVVECSGGQQDPSISHSSEGGGGWQQDPSVSCSSEEGAVVGNKAPVPATEG